MGGGPGADYHAGAMGPELFLPSGLVRVVGLQGSLHHWGGGCTVPFASILPCPPKVQGPPSDGDYTQATPALILDSPEGKV